MFIHYYNMRCSVAENTATSLLTEVRYLLVKDTLTFLPSQGDAHPDQLKPVHYVIEFGVYASARYTTSLV